MLQRMKRFRTMILMMIPVLPIVGLVGASNLSTAIIILGIAVVLIFVADPKYVRFILMGSIGELRGFSGDGKLSIGTPGNLETSGAI